LVSPEQPKENQMKFETLVVRAVREGACEREIKKIRKLGSYEEAEKHRCAPAWAQWLLYRDEDIELGKELRMDLLRVAVRSPITAPCVVCMKGDVPMDIRLKAARVACRKPRAAAWVYECGICGSFPEDLQSALAEAALKDPESAHCVLCAKRHIPDDIRRRAAMVCAADPDLALRVLAHLSERSYEWAEEARRLAYAACLTDPEGAARLAGLRLYPPVPGRIVREARSWALTNPWGALVLRYGFHGEQAPILKLRAETAALGDTVTAQALSALKDLHPKTVKALKKMGLR